MSWNLNPPEIKAEKVEAARFLLKKNTSAPQSIKDYVNICIDGLVAKYGPDVLVSVVGYGHLCTGAASYELSSALIEVRPAQGKIIGNADQIRPNPQSAVA